MNQTELTVLLNLECARIDLMFLPTLDKIKC